MLGPQAGTCPAWRLEGGGEEALPNPWLRAEDSGGKGCWMLGFGVGEGPWAYQLTSTVWVCRAPGKQAVIGWVRPP